MVAQVTLRFLPSAILRDYSSTYCPPLPLPLHFFFPASAIFLTTSHPSLNHLTSSLLLPPRKHSLTSLLQPELCKIDLSSQLSAPSSHWHPVFVTLSSRCFSLYLASFAVKRTNG